MAKKTTKSGKRMGGRTGEKCDCCNCVCKDCECDSRKCKACECKR